jgi:hypothetical protein
MGKIIPCDEQSEIIAKEALFSTHPSMEHWPQDHDFHAHEMVLDSVWMIANFGGGSEISAEEYYQTEPSHHHISEADDIMPLPTDNIIKIPDWNNTVARARWITHHSRWGTVSTTQHNYHQGQYFGNVRSVTDGAYCESSTGRPIFQFPDVDPAAKDLVHTDHKIAITFSEASIAARVSSETGTPCNGEDVGSPTCGQVVLYGQAVPINSSSVHFHHALGWFKQTHPLAPWLSEGGSHMTGTYYTIEIGKILILDYFGGYHEVSVGDYLQYDMSKHAGEYCQGYSHTGDMKDQQEKTQDSFQVFYVGIFGAVMICLMARIRLGSGENTKQKYHSVAETGSTA